MTRHMASGEDKWLQIARQLASGGTSLQPVRFYLHNLVFQVMPDLLAWDLPPYSF